MKNKLFVGILFIGYLIISISCQTQQIGGTYEARENASSLGVVYAGDVTEYMEFSLVYLPNMYPEIAGIEEFGVGMDYNIKIPFHFARNRLSIFPIAGIEGRYIHNTDYTREDETFGFGIKFGGGFDISFTPSFFLRGKTLYQPEATSFMNSYPGYRFNLALGYRTNYDSVREKIEYEQGSRNRTQREQARASKTPIKSQQDEYWDLANNHRKNGKYVLAAEEMEKIVKIDPDYRLSTTYSYSPSQAAPFGIRTDQKIEFSNISIYAMIAFMYFDIAGTGSDPERFAPQASRQETFEKALSAYQKAYEIDITGGRNNNRDLQKIYLAGIGLTLDRLGRTDEANSYYTELSKISGVTDRVATRIGIPAQGTHSATSSSSRQTTNVQNEFTLGFVNVNIITKETNKETAMRLATVNSYNGSARNIIIPSTYDGKPIQMIGKAAFSNKGLTGVTFCGSEIIIEEASFGRNQLRNINLPLSLGIIEKLAFYDNLLTKITIPDNVFAIGEGAFYGNKIVDITIGKDVDLGANCFEVPGALGFLDDSFILFYDKNGKKAGRYVFVQTDNLDDYLGDETRIPWIFTPK